MSEITTILKSHLRNELKKGSSKDKDFILYHSLEAEQMLLPEAAHFLAVKTYFRMLGIPLACESRSNAEFLSPGGENKTRLPVLRAGTDLSAEFRPIVSYLTDEGFSLWPEEVDPQEYRRWQSGLLDMDLHFTNAELYLCWVDDKVRNEITNERYGSPYEWPLNQIQCWRKKREVRSRLEIEDWYDMSLSQVAEEIKYKCVELSEKLQDKPYFNGNYPTEFDALIFGHLFTILATELKNPILSEEIIKKKNLVRFCQNIESTYFSRKPSR